MPNVCGILETALYVKDVTIWAAFFRRLFGFNTLRESERLIALDVVGRNVLLLFKEGATSEHFPTPGGTIPGHAGTGPSHFAFSITGDSVNDWRKRLMLEGVSIESEVTWEGGAKSLYFRDPDNHLVELITPGFWPIYELLRASAPSSSRFGADFIAFGYHDYHNTTLSNQAEAERSW